MLAVPLTIRGKATGTLVFYYRAPHAFTEVEIETGRALGNLAATAMTTAELYDDQEQSHRKTAFLAQAGSALAISLDYMATLKRVAELAVPHIADWCAVDLASDSGRIERLAVAHVDPQKVELARRFRERYPADPESPYGVPWVIRTGRSVMLADISDAMIVAAARSEDHLQAIRELSIKSFMCVPLLAHRRTLGAITFVAAESGRRYGESDLHFAEDVASRAALAVENARAYDEARRANRLKDDFLATLSHELRTPLNAILGYARMLRSGVLTGDKQARGLEVVERSAVSLAQIVEDVLDVSRIVSGKIRLNVQPVELPVVVNDAVGDDPAGRRRAPHPRTDGHRSARRPGVGRSRSAAAGRLEPVDQCGEIHAARGARGRARRGGRLAGRDHRERYGHWISRGVRAAPLRAFPAGPWRVRPRAWRPRTGPGDRAAAGRDARRDDRSGERGQGSGRDVPRPPAADGWAPRPAPCARIIGAGRLARSGGEPASRRDPRARRRRRRRRADAGARNPRSRGRARDDDHLRRRRRSKRSPVRAPTC